MVQLRVCKQLFQKEYVCLYVTFELLYYIEVPFSAFWFDHMNGIWPVTDSLQLLR